MTSARLRNGRRAPRNAVLPTTSRAAVGAGPTDSAVIQAVSPFCASRRLCRPAKRSARVAAGSPSFLRRSPVCRLTDVLGGLMAAIAGIF